MWKGILSTRALIHRGPCYRVGNGYDIDAYSDPWIPGIDLLTHTARASSLCKVAALIDFENQCWEPAALDQRFDARIVNAINSIPFPGVDCSDKLCWTVQNDGKFSVKSCFNLIQEEGQNNELFGV